MRSPAWYSVLILVALVACSRSEDPAPEPASVPEATAPAEKDLQATLDSGIVIGDDDATVVIDGFQFFVQAAEPDVFEIDADASRFLGYAPTLVKFGARALSGTPPYTFSWNFGDDSELGTGDRVTHLFEKTGRLDVFVTGRDAAGDEAVAQLALILFTREEWARTRQLDIETLSTPTPLPK